jgi:hypothetical protein
VNWGNNMAVALNGTQLWPFSTDILGVFPLLCACVRACVCCVCVCCVGARASYWRARACVLACAYVLCLFYPHYYICAYQFELLKYYFIQEYRRHST